MAIKPHDYQEEALTQIHNLFQTKNKILYQLSTAGGKTFVFSFLTKRWNERTGKRVLILCHRNELVTQTIESMNMIGVTCEKVTSKVSKLNHDSQCYVSMIQTAYNRLVKDPFFFKNVDLVIADECHLMLFDKVFDFFKSSKILGVTATPVVLKRIKFWKCKHCKEDYNEEIECCEEITQEWSRPFSMSELYEEIIIGPPIKELIERGNLVQELSFIKDYADTGKLVTGSDGEITSKSTDEAYSNDDAVFNVVLNYEAYCKGRKTMIFNGSSKGNLMVYEKFKEAGINVRMYDSVNKEQSGSRTELVKWFKEEDDAVLLNVGCFTTGFDVKEVEAIIMNFATNSLALYIQIVGRGARSTDKIYKPHFVFVDGGGNIDRHQEFSDPSRDWHKIFREGVGSTKPKKQEAFDVQNCPECGSMYMKTESCCPECGFVILPEPKKHQEKSLSEDVLMPIRKIPPPNGEKIYQYTLKKEENINFAFKIMISQIVDMFRYYRVSKTTYLNTLASGKLQKRVKTMINKCYFVLLSKSDIQTEGRRTIAHLTNKTLTKLEEYYGN